MYEVKMIQEFKLKDFPNIDNLHDCETSAVEFKDKKFILSFNKEGLGVLLPNGKEKYPYNKLTITYILNNEINYNESNDCSIRQINERERLMDKAILQWSLLEFVNFLHADRGNLKLFSQYYNQGKCIIFSELISNKEWQIGNWFEIELFIDEILFEWD